MAPLLLLLIKKAPGCRCSSWGSVPVFCVFTRSCSGQLIATMAGTLLGSEGWIAGHYPTTRWLFDLATGSSRGDPREATSAFEATVVK